MVVDHKKNLDAKERGRITYIFQELGSPDNPGTPDQNLDKNEGNGNNQENIQQDVENNRVIQ